MVSIIGYILLTVLYINHVKSDISLRPNDLVDIYAPVFATFYDNDTINVEIIPRYAKFLANNGISGVLVCAISGEGPVITLKERMLFSDAWVAAAKRYNLQVMLQISALPFQQALMLANYAKRTCVDAILALPEFYYRPSTVQQLVYFIKLISLQAPNTPLFYEDTVSTGVDVNMVNFFAEASSQIPSFSGLISDLLTNLQVAASTKLRSNQRLFSTSTSGVTSFLELNINGTISITCNVFPKLCTDVLTAAQSGRLAEALDLQEKLNERVLAITRYDRFQNYCYISLLKVAMEMVTGIPVGEVRRPLTVVGCKTRKAIAQNLRKLGVKIVKESECKIEEHRGVVGE